MAEYYTGRKKSEKSHLYPPETSKGKSKLFKLVLKQTSACICCGLIVWGMYSVPISRLNNYARALGSALNYETDLSSIKKTGVEIFHWFKNRFTPLDDTDIPSTPQPEIEQQL